MDKERWGGNSRWGTQREQVQGGGQCAQEMAWLVCDGEEYREKLEDPEVSMGQVRGRRPKWVTSMNTDKVVSLAPRDRVWGHLRKHSYGTEQ